MSAANQGNDPAEKTSSVVNMDTGIVEPQLEDPTTDVTDIIDSKSSFDRTRGTGGVSTASIDTHANSESPLLATDATQAEYPCENMGATGCAVKEPISGVPVAMDDVQSVVPADGSTPASVTVDASTLDNELKVSAVADKSASIANVATIDDIEMTVADEDEASIRSAANLDCQDVWVSLVRIDVTNEQIEEALKECELASLSERRDHLRSSIKSPTASRKWANLYPCCECSERFHKLSSVLEHGRELHNIEFPEEKILDLVDGCPKCEKKYKHCDSQRKHDLMCNKGKRSHSEAFSDKQEDVHDMIAVKTESTADKDLRMSLGNSHDVGPQMVYQCHMCTRIVSSRGNMQRHLINLHGVVPTEEMVSLRPKEVSEPKCDVCAIILPNWRKLQKHLVMEHPSKPDVSHTKVHTESSDIPKNQQTEAMLRCLKCGKGFGSSTQLCSHMKKVHRSKSRSKNHRNLPKPEAEMHIYSCNICGKVLDRKDKIEVHVVQVHRMKVADPKYYTATLPSEAVYREPSCPTCGLKFSDWRPLYVHIRRKHGGGKINPEHKLDKLLLSGKKKKGANTGASGRSTQHVIQDDSPGILVYPCHLCGQVLSRTSVRKHLMKIHGTTPTEIPLAQVQEKLVERIPPTCVYCKSRFETFVLLYHHIKSSHGSMKKKKTPRHVNCSSCSLVFQNEEQLQYHVEHCTNKGGMESHNIAIKSEEIEHEEDLVFPCSLCSRVPLSLNQLRSHMRKVHRIEGGDFTPIEGIPKSEAEDPIPSCKQCQKEYSTWKTLYVHLKKGVCQNSETDLRKGICQKSETDLRKGIRQKSETVLPAGRHRCNECGILFRSRVRLEQHCHRAHSANPARVAKHSSTEVKKDKKLATKSLPPIICPLCDKEYDDESIWFCHLRVIHRLAEHKREAMRDQLRLQRAAAVDSTSGSNESLTRNEKHGAGISVSAGSTPSRKTFSCGHCSCEYQNWHSLLRHHHGKHQKIAPPTNSQTKVNASKHTVNKHKRIFSEDNISLTRKVLDSRMTRLVSDTPNQPASNTFTSDSDSSSSSDDDDDWNMADSIDSSSSDDSSSDDSDEGYSQTYKRVVPSRPRIVSSSSSSSSSESDADFSSESDADQPVILEATAVPDNEDTSMAHSDEDVQLVVTSVSKENESYGEKSIITDEILQLDEDIFVKNEPVVTSKDSQVQNRDSDRLSNNPPPTVIEDLEEPDLEIVPVKSVTSMSGDDCHVITDETLTEKLAAIHPTFNKNVDSSTSLAPKPVTPLLLFTSTGENSDIDIPHKYRSIKPAPVAVLRPFSASCEESTPSGSIIVSSCTIREAPQANNTETDVSQTTNDFAQSSNTLPSYHTITVSHDHVNNFRCPESSSSSDAFEISFPVYIVNLEDFILPCISSDGKHIYKRIIVATNDGKASWTFGIWYEDFSKCTWHVIALLPVPLPSPAYQVARLMHWLITKKIASMPFSTSQIPKLTSIDAADPPKFTVVSKYMTKKHSAICCGCAQVVSSLEEMKAHEMFDHPFCFKCHQPGMVLGQHKCKLVNSAKPTVKFILLSEAISTRCKFITVSPSSTITSKAETVTPNDACKIADSIGEPKTDSDNKTVKSTNACSQTVDVENEIVSEEPIENLVNGSMPSDDSIATSTPSSKNITTGEVQADAVSLSEISDLKSALHASPHRCNFCDVAFLMKVQLDHHRSRLHKKCTVCEHVFRNRQERSEHITDMHAQFICLACDHTCSSNEAVKGHIIRDHVDLKTGLFDCAKCNKQIHPEALVTHLEMDDSESNLLCYLCNFKLSGDTVSDVQHFLSHAVSVRNCLPCLICNEIYLEPWALARHIASKTARHFAYCRQCLFVSEVVNEKCHCDGSSTVHMAVTARAKKCWEGMPANTRCNLCWEQCEQTEQLRRHCDKEHAEFSIQCDICGQRFEYDHQRQFHMGKHKKALQYTVCWRCYRVSLKEVKLDRYARDTYELCLCTTCTRQIKLKPNTEKRLDDNLCEVSVENVTVVAADESSTGNVQLVLEGKLYDFVPGGDAESDLCRQESVDRNAVVSSGAVIEFSDGGDESVKNDESEESDALVIDEVVSHAEPAISSNAFEATASLGTGTADGNPTESSLKMASETADNHELTNALIAAPSSQGKRSSSSFSKSKLSCTICHFKCAFKAALNKHMSRIHGINSTVS